MQNIPAAVDFLKHHLPAEFRSRIDFSEIGIESTNLVTAELREFHTDVVYSCKIDGRTGYVLTLVEHQSTPDKMMAFRKLQYNVLLMDNHLKKGNKKLPVIFNLCLYNGTDSPYPESTCLFECFDHVELAKQVLFSPFTLIDLTIIPDDEIKQHGLASTMEMLLKHARLRDMRSAITSLIKDHLIQDAIEKLGENYLKSVLTYMLSVGEDKKDNREAAKEILDNLTHALPEQENLIMTFAQTMTYDAKQEGMQQGRQQGIDTMFEALKKQGVDPSLLAQAKNDALK